VKKLLELLLGSLYKKNYTTSFNSSTWKTFGDQNKTIAFDIWLQVGTRCDKIFLHPCFLWAIEESFSLKQNKLGSCTYGEMKLSELFIAIVFIRKHQYGLNTCSFNFQ
jgi:hypothetical protein